jgi:outer membrane lipoprotein-sorting protein
MLAAAVWLAACAGAAAEACGERGAGDEQKGEPPTVSPETAEVLDAMEAAGKGLETVRARFDYELNQTLYEDITKRKGELVFAVPNLVRFTFTSKPRETVIFDGRKVYQMKDATKQLYVWTVREEDEPPVESMELGKAPFPIPFGQKKEKVVKFFEVSRNRAEEEKDGKKRHVLALVPREDTSLAKTYTKVALWVDTETRLPTRVRLWDTSENITTIDFHDIKTNTKVDESTFKRPKVPEDWEVIVPDA